ncbi:hypothetical protein JOD21_002618 [Jeotgalibacillus terrae]|nr:hypothetical protein [Jeotgalibacillus terrae]
MVKSGRVTISLLLFYDIMFRKLTMIIIFDKNEVWLKKVIILTV